MYVGDDYLNYKYVVSVSDNYVVLTNRRNVSASWESPTTINVIYKYLKPSFLTVEGERIFSTSQNFQEINVSSNDFERADYCDFFNSAMLFICVIIFTIITSVTRLVKKGGVVNGQ